MENSIENQNNEIQNNNSYNQYFTQQENNNERELEEDYFENDQILIAQHREYLQNQFNITFENIDEQIKELQKDIEKERKRGRERQAQINEQEVQKLLKINADYLEYKEKNEENEYNEMNSIFQKMINENRIDINNINNEIEYAQYDLKEMQERKKPMNKINELQQQLNELIKVQMTYQNLEEMRKNIEKKFLIKQNIQKEITKTNMLQSKQIQTIEELVEEIENCKKDIIKYQQRNQKIKLEAEIIQLQELQQILDLHNEIQNNIQLINEYSNHIATSQTFDIQPQNLDQVRLENQQILQQEEQKMQQVQNEQEQLQEPIGLQQNELYQNQYNRQIQNEAQNDQNLNVIDKDLQEKQNLYFMYQKALQMPICQERYLKLLISLVAKLQYGKLVENEDIPNDQQYILQEIENNFQLLRNQIKIEENNNISFQKDLIQVEKFLKSFLYKQAKLLLNKCFTQLVQIDIEYLQLLIYTLDTYADPIRNKPIILFLGGTGAGKSTTIHYLSGSIMSYVRAGEFQNHIGPVNVTNQQLLKIKTSPFAQSETKYISPVYVEFKQVPGSKKRSGYVWLCDTPGFNDSRGVEQDISNGIGVIRAIQECKSIIPIVLLSYKSQGNRSEGLKELAEIIIQMCNGNEDVIRSLKFLFTNYSNEQKRDIIAAFKDLREKTNENEQAYCMFLDRLLDEAEREKIFVEPLNENPPGLLLDKIAEYNKLGSPISYFQPFLSEKAKNAITEQIHNYKSSIKIAFQNKMFDLIIYRLNQMKFLIDLIDKQFIQKMYEDILTEIKKEINRISFQALDSFNKSLQFQQIIQVQEVQAYSDFIKVAHSYNQLRTDFLDNEGISELALIENIHKQIQAIKDSCFIKQLDNPFIKQSLQNLQIIITVPAFQFANQHIKDILEFIILQSEQQIKIFNKSLESLDFKTCSQILDALRQIQIDFSEYFENKQLENNYTKVKQLLVQYIQKQSEESIIYLQNEEKLPIEYTQQIQNTLEIISSIKNCQDFSFKQHKIVEDILKLEQIIIENILKRANQIALAIKNDFSQDKIQALNFMESKFDQLYRIFIINEAQKETYKIFYQVFKEIQNFICKIQQEISQITSQLYQDDNQQRFDRIRYCIGCLEKASWIKKYEDQPSYDEIIQETKQSVELYCNNLYKGLSLLQCDIDYQKDILDAISFLNKINKMEVLCFYVQNLQDTIDKSNQFFKQKVDRAVLFIKKEMNDNENKSILDFKCKNFLEKCFNYLELIKNSQQNEKLSASVQNQLQQFAWDQIEEEQSRFQRNYNRILNYKGLKDEQIYLEVDIRKQYLSLLQLWEFYLQCYRNTEEDELTTFKQSKLLQFIQDQQDLQSKLDTFRIHQNYQQFNIYLEIVKTLCQLDLFTEGYKFNDVYLKSKNDFSANKEGQQHNIALINNYDYINIKDILQQLEEQKNEQCIAQLKNLKIQLSNQTENLINDSKMLVFSLSIKQNFTLKNINEIVLKLDYLHRAIQNVLPYISESIDLKENFETIKASANKIILKNFNNLDMLINTINFIELEKEVEKLSVVQQNFQKYQTQEIIDKFNQIEQIKQTKLEEKVQQFKNISIFKYNQYQPKDILNKLEMAKYLDNDYHNKIILIIDYIIQNLHSYLSQLQSKKTKTQINQGLERIRTIYPYLTDTLQTEFTQIIEEFKASMINDEQQQQDDLQDAIRQDNIEKLNSLLKEYKKDQKNNRELINQIIQHIVFKVKELQRDIQNNLNQLQYENIFVLIMHLYTYYINFQQDIKEIQQCYYEIKSKLLNTFKKDLQKLKALFEINQQSMIKEIKAKQVIFDIECDSQTSLTQNKKDNNINDCLQISLAIEILKNEKYYENLNNQRKQASNSKITSLEQQFNVSILEEIFSNYKSKFSEIEQLAGKSSFDITQQFNECINNLNSSNIQSLLQVVISWDFMLTKVFDDNDLKNLDFFKNLNEIIKSNCPYNKIYEKLNSTIEEQKQNILNLSFSSQQDCIQKQERDNYYLNVRKSFQFLQNIKYFTNNIDTSNQMAYEECLKDFNNKILIIQQDVQKLLSNDNISKVEFNLLNYQISSLISIKDILNNYCDQVKIDLNIINKQIKNRFKDLEEIILKSDDYEQITKALIKIKETAKSLPIFSEQLDQMIEDSLNEFKKNKGSKGIGILGTYMSKQEVGKQILQEQKQFEGYQRRLYNQRVQSYTITQVLDKIDGTSIDKKFLKQKYEQFDIKYKELVETNLNISMKFDTFITNFKLFVSQIKMNRESYKIQKIANFVSKLLFGDQQQKQEIMTTNLEWKPQTVDNIIDLIAYLFAYWTLKTSQHYVEAQGQESQKLYLFIPHASQIVSIFRLLGLGTFKNTILNNLVEIKTGEGKSVTLAIAAATLATLGFQVYVACYSQYLTDRDYRQFQSYFIDLNIDKSIQYGTFNTLAENIINENGDIRNLVRNKITGQSYAKNNKLNDKNQMKILLIDEVDVFFSKELFGNTYCAQSSLQDDTITKLIDYLWENKDNNLSYNQMIGSQEYQSCLKNTKFAGYEFLIEAAFKDMVNDIKDFKTHDYIVAENKIGYKEQDNVVFNSVYGYKTLFAYLHEIQEGNIIKDDNLEKFQSIGINCGWFSYAEILLEFSLIVGVTGSLQALSTEEKDIIHNFYNINFFTYMPSVYGDSRLQKMDQRQDIKIVNQDDYYTFIIEEIEKKLQTNNSNFERAVLVFFDKKSSLKDFYENSQAKYKFQYLQLLYEGASEQEKNSKINYASSSGYVTLLTREYGRGTDFISRDDNVNNSGGVHVLQTFLSDSQSEETQIKGRTARQGQRGSYNMVLLEQSLEKFNVDLNYINNNESQQYDYLKQQRDTFFLNQYLNNIQFVESARLEHNEAKSFLNALLQGNNQEIKKFLSYKNVGKPIINKRVKIMCLMDATISMGNLLQKAKNTVNEMFNRANTILKQAQLQEECFKIQFVVFRNYNSQSKILQYSPWESKSENIYNFMTTIQAEGGWGNEAIEVGLLHANQEHFLDPLNQVILIGDAAANTISQVTNKRENCNYINPKYQDLTHYKIEIKKLLANNIPVNAFYVNENAKTNFQEIADYTKGKSSYLDINSPAGADLLTDLVTKEVLKQAGDLAGKGDECVQLYEKKYGRSYI